MARPQKKGFDYFNLDTDHFQDMKIKRLKKDHGAAGYAVYQYILNEIYRVNGCYIVWDESTAFDVSEYWGLKESHVSEIVRYCLAVGLFDRDLAERSKALPLRGSVLSSRSIQSRYIEMLRATKRSSGGIPEAINLLGKSATVPTTKALENGVFSEETPVFSEKTPVFSEETPVFSEKTPVFSEETRVSSGRKYTKKSKVNKEKTTVVVKKKVELSFSRPPQQQEVEAFVRAEGLQMDVAGFMSYNEMRGWKGVCDWKAAARRWASKEKPPPKRKDPTVATWSLPTNTAPTKDQNEEFRKRFAGYIEDYNAGKRGSILEILRAAKRNGNLSKYGLEWEER